MKGENKITHADKVMAGKPKPSGAAPAPTADNRQSNKVTMNDTSKLEPIQMQANFSTNSPRLSARGKVENPGFIRMKLMKLGQSIDVQPECQLFELRCQPLSLREQIARK